MLLKAFADENPKLTLVVEVLVARLPALRKTRKDIRTSINVLIYIFDIYEMSECNKENTCYLYQVCPQLFILCVICLPLIFWRSKLSE